jgi:hypothetical protein
VNEGDQLALGAATGDLVDEPDAGGATAGEDRVEIVDGEADMVNARPAPVDESADRAVGGLRRQELDEGITGRPSGRPSTSR